MPKARRGHAKAVPTRRRAKTTGTDAAEPAHLPLPADPATASLTPKVDTRVARRRDRTILPSNSLVRQKVLAIIAGRLAGKSNEDIAAELHITVNSLKQYMWLAGKNGWLSKKAVDPTDRLEYEIAHKVVRNLDEMLDSEDEGRRDVATIKTAEGMLFKRFNAEANQPPPMTMIGVRIEMPTGVTAEIREGTTGGAGHYVDAEVTRES